MPCRKYFCVLCVNVEMRTDNLERHIANYHGRPDDVALIMVYTKMWKKTSELMLCLLCCHIGISNMSVHMHKKHPYEYANFKANIVGLHANQQMRKNARKYMHDLYLFVNEPHKYQPPCHPEPTFRESLLVTIDHRQNPNSQFLPEKERPSLETGEDSIFSAELSGACSIPAGASPASGMNNNSGMTPLALQPASSSTLPQPALTLPMFEAIQIGKSADCAKAQPLPVISSRPSLETGPREDAIFSAELSGAYSIPAGASPASGMNNNSGMTPLALQPASSSTLPQPALTLPMFEAIQIGKSADCAQAQPLPVVSSFDIDSRKYGGQLSCCNGLRSSMKYRPKATHNEIVNRLLNRDDSAVRVEPTENKGMGAFAAIDLASGAFICEYEGELLKGDSLNLRDSQYMASNQTTWYLFDFQINGTKYTIDATKSNCLGRYLNHSHKNPNAIAKQVMLPFPESRPAVFFLTKRYILAGEELCFNYMNNVPLTQYDLEKDAWLDS